MRTSCWASACIAAAALVGCRGAPAQQPGPVASVTSPGSSATGPTTVVAKASGRGNTRLELRPKDGAPLVLEVARDATVDPSSEPTRTDVVGEVPGVAVILVDTYPSIPGPMSMCQAGEERFLRVLSLAQRPIAQTYVVKLESCRDDVELVAPGVQWRSDCNVLHLDWLRGPSGKGSPESSNLHITQDGHAEQHPEQGESCLQLVH